MQNRTKNRLSENIGKVSVISYVYFLIIYFYF